MSENILVIDNYDSFTYNLVHALNDLARKEVTVQRNDEIDFSLLDSFDTLVLSPGPGIPDEAGQLKEVIEKMTPHKKILGVCLGHQAIGETFGATLQNLSSVYHGIQTRFYLTDIASPIFRHIDNVFEGGRYHSWVIQKDTLSSEFEVTCQDADGEIMAIQHKRFNVFGVQFHPESILTPKGKTILNNFLNVNGNERNPK